MCCVSIFQNFGKFTLNSGVLTVIGHYNLTVNLEETKLLIAACKGWGYPIRFLNQTKNYLAGQWIYAERIAVAIRVL